MLGFIAGPAAVEHAPQAGVRAPARSCSSASPGCSARRARHRGAYLEQAWAEEEWSARRPGLLAGAGRAHRLRRGVAPPVRPRPLGGRRDRDRLVRVHGRRGPLRRARGRGGRSMRKDGGCERRSPLTRARLRRRRAPGGDAARRRRSPRASWSSSTSERIERIDPRSTPSGWSGPRGAGGGDAADERLDARARRRPLLGRPDRDQGHVDVAGDVTSFGTGGFDEPADEDSDPRARGCARRARSIGKTNLPELAIHGFTESKTFGITRNPWNPERTTGGSSGGSGAAVAAGLAAIAHASDGAGSIRYPAAHCGLFGLKPQRDRVPIDARALATGSRSTAASAAPSPTRRSSSTRSPRARRGRRARRRRPSGPSPRPRRAPPGQAADRAHA